MFNPIFPKWPLHSKCFSSSKAGSSYLTKRKQPSKVKE